MLNLNAYIEPLRDYLATMLQDAHNNWNDDENHFDEECPEPDRIDEAALEDAYGFIEAYHQAFPYHYNENRVDGGELYLERFYGESQVPKDVAEWIHENWSTDATPSIAKSIHDEYLLFVE